MQITINEEIHYLEKPYPSYLQEVLDLLVPDLKTKGIAIALNDQVIARKLWPETPISDQAELLIITATQGG